MVEINHERGIIDMFVKKFKRKCDVRGCKNTANVFLISKRREMGNTIAMCRDCMQEAITATKDYVEPVKVKKEVKHLFPHPELRVTISSVADKEPEPIEVIEEAAEERTKSVAEDTVTYKEAPIIATTTPDVVLTSEATQTNGKKRTNKKK